MTGEQLAERLKRVGALHAAIAIAQRNGTDFDAIASCDRHRSPTRARHQIAAYLRVKTRMSLPEIGALLNRRHDTVLKGIRRGIVRVRVKAVAA